MELAFLILPPFLHLPLVPPPGSAGGPEWEGCLFHSDPGEMQERLQNN